MGKISLAMVDASQQFSESRKYYSFQYHFKIIKLVTLTIRSAL